MRDYVRVLACRECIVLRNWSGVERHVGFTPTKMTVRLATMALAQLVSIDNRARRKITCIYMSWVSDKEWEHTLSVFLNGVLD